MKVVVTGGRDFKNQALVYSALDKLTPTQVIVGDCPTGVDAFVRSWAESTRCPILVYEAYWKAEGKKAGPLRNRRMVRENPDAMLIAFPGGRGTNSCKFEARDIGMPIFEVRLA